MSELTWNEKVPTISIHPEIASMKDVARLAAELMEANRKLSEVDELRSNLISSEQNRTKGNGKL